MEGGLGNIIETQSNPAGLPPHLRRPPPHENNY